MSTESKISLSSDDFERIRAEINMLSIICTDDVVKKRLIELSNHLNEMTNSQNINIEEMIEKKLVETKRTDKDLNASLYILYQNLKREKISVEDAKRLFEDYLRLAEYNKNNYIL
jgi:phosphotransacetylase